MNSDKDAAELLKTHLDGCKGIFEALCAEMVEKPAEAAGLVDALRSGELTLQILTTFKPLPVVQGLIVDAGGQKSELFRLTVDAPKKMV